jgi:hypothetical protein
MMQDDDDVVVEILDTLPPRGRPAEYKPEFAKQAAKLCKLGATDFELAEFFEVDTRTIYRWKNTFPAFCQAVVAGKKKADDRVERALFNRAVGYTYESEKLFCYEGVVTRAQTIDHVAPDPGAAMNWLKNRRPDKWREKTHTEHGVSDGLAELMKAIDGKTRGLPSKPDPKP